MKRNTIISNFGAWQMLLNITKSADLQIWLIQLAEYIEYAFISLFILYLVHGMKTSLACPSCFFKQVIKY